MIGKIHRFDSRLELASVLSQSIVSWAQDSAPAQLLLSGGSTPRELLGALAAASRPPGLEILPVDDRCVAVDDSRSNYGMFRATLGSRGLRPLYDADLGPEGSAAALNAGAGALALSRFTVLGLGPDGHTASLFPGSADLARGLDPEAPDFIVSTPTMAPLVPRLTLTAAPILASDRLVLHFHGEDKWTLFVEAQAGEPEVHPIAHFLRHASTPVDIYYAP